MIFTHLNPHPALTDYVAAYWIAKGDSVEWKTEKILPDGCIDIIFNLGDECKTANGVYTLQNEKAYLVGTTTRFIEVNMNSETNLLGIRFKPAAFSMFFTYDSLDVITDKTVEFENKLTKDHAYKNDAFFNDDMCRLRYGACHWSLAGNACKDDI